MTRYEDKHFTVGARSGAADENYRRNFDRVFADGPAPTVYYPLTLTIHSEEEAQLVREGLIIQREILMREYNFSLSPALDRERLDRIGAEIKTCDRLLDQIGFSAAGPR